MNAQIAALGPKDFVLPFGAVGAVAFPVENDEQAVQQGRAILQQGFAVVLVYEALAETLAGIFESVQEQPTPAVVALPFIEPSSGQAVQQLRMALRRATGTDIWDSATPSESPPVEPSPTDMESK